MNTPSPRYHAMAGKAPRLLAVAGLAALAVAVPGTSQAAPRRSLRRPRLGLG